MTRDGKSEVEQRRIRVAVNVWWRMEGVMADRNISRKLKGKVLMLCVTLGYLYRLETVTPTERQQRLLVCENDCVRRIAGVKRVDRRRMEEFREEIGVQMSLTGRLVKCRLRGAGYSVQMGEERMAKRADRFGEQGRGKRGRQWLRWEDYVTRDIRKVGVVGE